MKNYVEDIITSALNGEAYNAYKSLIADLITPREGTYAEVIELLFKNSFTFAIISAVLDLVFLILGIAGIWIPFNGLLIFAISVINIDTYLLTSSVDYGVSFQTFIISLVPVLCAIIYCCLNGPERRERKNAKLQAKSNIRGEA